MDVDGVGGDLVWVCLVGKALDRVPRGDGHTSARSHMTADRRARGDRVLVCGGDVHVGVVWVVLRNQRSGATGRDGTRARVT